MSDLCLTTDVREKHLNVGHLLMPYRWNKITRRSHPHYLARREDVNPLNTYRFSVVPVLLKKPTILPFVDGDIPGIC